MKVDKWVRCKSGDMINVYEPKVLRRDPAFFGKPDPKFISKVPKLLSARNEYFEGTAVYEFVSGMWRVTKCSDCLSFLKNKNPAEAKLELLKRGYTYEWS